MSEVNKKKYQKRYERNGCTKGQLLRLAELGALTAAEYEEITGEAYTGEVSAQQALQEIQEVLA